MNLCFTGLHLRWPPGCGVFVAVNNSYNHYSQAFASSLLLLFSCFYATGGVTQWADEYRMLPKKSSSEPGKYRSSRTPYVREIMDALSPSDPTQEICVMKATQIGMTEVGNCWIGYVIDVAPGPMLAIFPTGDLARDHSKHKLQPSIEETPRLRGKVRKPKSRESGNTILVKEFPGGMIILSGSNSPVSFRSRTIRYLFLDDIDGYERDVGGEGDPIELAKKRTDTYSARKKIFEVSTPTTEGISRIAISFDESDQRQYHVPCPYCEQLQVLEFGGKDLNYGIKFARDEDSHLLDVWYQCRHCKERIDERHKTAMLEEGVWIPKQAGRRKRGYHLSALYSPLGWVSWRQIVEEFLEIKGNREKLKVWRNTRMGETFEEMGNQPDWLKLKSRCEPYEMMTVPAGGQILTAAVDVQGDRLAIGIQAWGRGETSWLIFYGEIYGDPRANHVWEQCDMLLNRSFPGVDGQVFSIKTMAVDSGGHHTQEVYNYCRFRGSRVIAIKGASQTGRPVIGRPNPQDVSYMGEKIPAGVMLWPVGTDTAKSTIYGRFAMAEPGPGYYRFPIGLDDEFFRQITAEKLVTTYDKRGFPKQEWVKMYERNEALDVLVYNYAAALRSGLVTLDIAPDVNAQKTPRKPAKRRNREPETASGWLSGTGGRQGGWIGG